MLSHDAIRERLDPPATPCRVILDTDAYNQSDDQFAIAYLMRSQGRAIVEGIAAAPFHNQRSTGPEDGMVKSFGEIKHVLRLLGDRGSPPVLKGSTRFMTGPADAVESDATKHLIARAIDDTTDGPLYVLAIGAITNVASALLLEPRLVERIVVVWLGGHTLLHPINDDFNLRQDPHAARTVFDCGVPLVWVPCLGAASHLITSIPELETYLPKAGRIGGYLLDRVRQDAGNPFAYSKVVWDIATVAWVQNPDWLPSKLMSSPILRDDLAWSPTHDRHPIRAVYHVDRDAVFADLFRKLGAASV